MKKLLFAVVVAGLAAGAIEAGRCFRNRCCPPARRRTCRTVCPERCEPAKPKCFKTIQVPETIMVDKCIEVEAIRTEHPQPDIVERIPQPPTEVKIPLPQQYRIEYRCNPDKVAYHKQDPVVRYHCPSDCDTR